MTTPSSDNDILKDPDATLDYTWDWYKWLPNGDLIITSEFIVDPGITVVLQTNTGTNCTVWLSGGVSGLPYQVTNRITTVQGRTDDRTVTIRVQQR